MEAAATSPPTATVKGVSSFAKSLFLGEIHEQLVFPFPRPDEDEQRKVRDLMGGCASTLRRTSTRGRSRSAAGSAMT